MRPAVELHSRQTPTGMAGIGPASGLLASASSVVLNQSRVRVSSSDIRKGTLPSHLERRSRRKIWGSLALISCISRAVFSPSWPNHRRSQAGCACGWNLTLQVRLRALYPAESWQNQNPPHGYALQGKKLVGLRLHICSIGNPSSHLLRRRSRDLP